MATPKNKKMTAADYIRDYWAVIVLALVFALAIILYLVGWRLGPGGMPTMTGRLVVEGVPSSAAVYLDQTQRHLVGAGGRTSLRLIPGTHSVIIDAFGYEPWNELVTAHDGADIVVRPLLVPKEPAFRLLEGEERAAAAVLMQTPMLPTPTAPLLMEGGCALVYVANNRILANATTTPTCTPPEYLLCPAEEGGVRDLPCPSATVIFPASERLDSITPYPGRDDALIVAAGTSAFLVELDPRTPQYLVLLGKAERVRVAPYASTSFLYSDQDRIIEFPLIAP